MCNSFINIIGYTGTSSTHASNPTKSMEYLFLFEIIRAIH